MRRVQNNIETRVTNANQRSIDKKFEARISKNSKTKKGRWGIGLMGIRFYPFSKKKGKEK